MTADRRSTIKTPWKIRVRRFMHGWPLQVLTFVALIVTIAFLWQRQGKVPNSVGRATATRVNVSAAAEGKLLPMYELSDGQWSEFDRVYKGQVVARLDDSRLQADLATITQETEALRAQLAQAELEINTDRTRADHDQMEVATELAREVERYRLDILDRLSELEQDRLILQRLETQLELAEHARSSGMLNRASFRQLQDQRKVQAKLVATHSSAYRQAQENHRAALKRLQSQPEVHHAEIQTVLAPLRAAIGAAEARVEHMHAQIAALEIRSPISGTIAAVHCYPGQGIRTGEWVVTIAADEAQHIIAYVRPDQQIRPVEGSSVGVRLRMPASAMVMTNATQVGSQWEPMPEELLRDPNRPELALPVKVAIPPELELRPGELVDIVFFPDGREGI